MAQSLRISGFSPRPVHVGFLVCRVTVGEIFVWVLRFPHVSVIPPLLYSFVCDRGYINAAVDSVIKQSTCIAVSLDDVWCHAWEFCWTGTGFASRLGCRFTWTFFSSVLSRLRKLRKATIRFVYLQHGTGRLPLDGFSWNSIFEYFAKICWEVCLIKIWPE